MILRVLSLLLTAGVVVGLVPRLADLAGAARVLGRLAPGWIAVLLLLAAGVLVSAWVALARLVGGVTIGEAGIAHCLSTCVANTVPAGGAVAVAVNLRVYAGFGRGAAQTTQGLLAMAALDNAVKIALPLLAAAVAPLLPGSLRLPPVAAVAAGILAVGAVTVGVVLLRSERLVGAAAARLEAAVRRRRTDVPAGSWRPAAVGYQRGLRTRLVEHGPVAALAVVAGHVLQVALLVAALRAVGVPSSDVGPADATIAYALMRLVTVLPVTPGGLGVAELGLLGGLGLAAGPGRTAQLAAAVLLFRGLTYLPPIVLAAPAWVLWRLRGRSRNRGTPPASGTCEGGPDRPRPDEE